MFFLVRFQLDGIPWNSIFGLSWKSVKKLQTCLKLDQKYSALYVKTSMHCAVAGDIICHKIAILKWKISGCLSVRPSVLLSACIRQLPLDGSPWNLILETSLTVFCEENKFVQNPIKISSKLRQERSTFIVGGDIKSQWKFCPRLKWYRAVRRSEGVQAWRETAIMVCYRSIIHLVHIRSRWRMRKFVTRMRGIKLSQWWISAKQTA